MHKDGELIVRFSGTDTTASYRIDYLELENGFMRVRWSNAGIDRTAVDVIPDEIEGMIKTVYRDIKG